MGLRGHGSAIAITALVTVVLASAGTAVAVTSTVVTIADPSNLARKAAVDTAGRLSVGPPNATIDTTNLASVTNGDNFVTSPTTATLAITKISFSNPSANSAASAAEVRYYLYKISATATSCTSGGGGVLLGIYNIAPGDDFEDNFSAPLTVRATNAAPYCLDLYAVTLNGTYNANYFPSYNLSAYVVAGRYTGVGAAATTSSPDVIGKQESSATR